MARHEDGNKIRAAFLDEPTIQLTNEVIVQGLRFPFTSTEARIFALLALSIGNIVSSSTIIAECWAEKASEKSYAYINSYMYRIRQALGQIIKCPLQIETIGSSYRLAGTYRQVDILMYLKLIDQVPRLKRSKQPEELLAILDEASLLIQEPFLGGLKQGQELSRWAQVLWNRQRSALEYRASILDCLERGDEILNELLDWVTRHPYDEVIIGWAMTTLTKQGWRAEALHLYHKTMNLLRSELGVNPTNKLQQIMGQIMKED